MSQDIVSLIANYGVAVAISVYLVYWITTKLNSKLDELTKQIEKLNMNIEKLNTLLSLSERLGDMHGKEKA